MTLNEKQALFTHNIAQLIVWAFKNNLPVIGAELFRTPEQAALYAKAGKGIKNSVHTKKLALDLFRVVDGSVSWAYSDYEKLGRKWTSMHELARWGGDWPRRDAVHFSFEHNGVK